MENLIVVLDFLSRAMAIALALGGVLAFFFKSLVKAWIDAYFKKRIETEQADRNHKLAVSLEEKKAALLKDLTRENDILKSSLMGDLEERKRVLDETFRRKQMVADKRVQFFDEYSTGYGTIFIELYALRENYFKPIEEANPELAVKLRSAMVVKIHQMLIDTQDKINPFEPYVDTELGLRQAQLFANLSTFLSEGAQENTQLEELALESSLIKVDMREKLFGEIEGE